MLGMLLLLLLVDNGIAWTMLTLDTLLESVMVPIDAVVTAALGQLVAAMPLPPPLVLRH